MLGAVPLSLHKKNKTMTDFVQWAKDREEQALEACARIRNRGVNSMTARASISRNEGIAQGLREAQEAYLRFQRGPTYILEQMRDKAMGVLGSPKGLITVEELMVRMDFAYEVPLEKIAKAIVTDFASGVAPEDAEARAKHLVTHWQNMLALGDTIHLATLWKHHTSGMS